DLFELAELARQVLEERLSLGVPFSLRQDAGELESVAHALRLGKEETALELLAAREEERPRLRALDGLSRLDFDRREALELQVQSRVALGESLEPRCAVRAGRRDALH